MRTSLLRKTVRFPVCSQPHVDSGLARPMHTEFNTEVLSTAWPDRFG